jgi:chromosome segregation ATPase
LFRLASVDLLSRDGQEVEFTIKRVLDVREPSRVSTGGYSEGPQHSVFNAPAYPEIVDLLQLRADIDGQREDINRIDSDGSKIVTALDTRVARVEEQVSKLKDTLGSLHRDFGGVQVDITALKVDISEAKRAAQDKAPLEELEKSLQTTNRTLNEIRQDVSSLEKQVREGITGTKSELRQQKQAIEDLRTDVRNRVTARDQAKDMAALRAEMAQMKRQMDEMRSKAAGRVTAAPFPSKELNILTSNIAKLGSRASQVETLQMEFEILKERVERAEASRQSPINQVRPYHGDTEDLPSYPRKRTLPGVGTPSSIDPTLKRTAFSSSYSEGPSQVYDGPQSPTDEERQETENGEQNVRTTRAGKKRGPKRQIKPTTS